MPYFNDSAREKGRGHSDLSRDLKELCFDQDTMAKTLLSDYGRFHSFLLVLGCANTIKTDDQIGEGPPFSRRFKELEGVRVLWQTSHLEKCLELFKAFQTRSEPSELHPCCWFIWSLTLFTLVQKLGPFPTSLPPALLPQKTKKK